MSPHHAYAPSANELIERNSELVRRIAWHMHGRIGRRAEIEELLQAGYLGLVDAAQRYRPQTGVTFAAYAAIRIRGSIVDHLRSAASMCRTTINGRKRLMEATEALTARLGRPPSEAELAETLGLDAEGIASLRSRIAASNTTSLSDAYSDHSLSFMDMGLSAEDAVEARQLKGLLRKALDTLGEREALVLNLYYVEELNVYEIADILGVTTGRVSQLKKAAIERLRQRMADLLQDPDTD